MPADAGHVSLPDKSDQGLQSGCDHIGIRCGQQARQVLAPHTGVVSEAQQANQAKASQGRGLTS